MSARVASVLITVPLTVSTWAIPRVNTTPVACRTCSQSAARVALKSDSW